MAAITPDSIAGVLAAGCAQLAADPALADTARLDCELLLAHVLGCSRTVFYTWPERTLDASQQQAFQALLQRRLAGEPVAHLLGQREFWTLSLDVDPSTLIPRPETELLVELALQYLPETPLWAVDLGTGTGAIALALASERPAWRWLALDVQPAAVQLAERNRRKHGLDNCVVVQGRWGDAVRPGAVSLVVSNPPYIAADDPHLQQGDVRFEPASALVADKAGLADLYQISRQAWDLLVPGGWLMMEHGADQGAAVRQYLQALGFSAVASQRDLAGLERVTLGQRC